MFLLVVLVHADQDWWVILIMGIMLGTMLIVFFVAAKIRAGAGIGSSIDLYGLLQ